MLQHPLMLAWTTGAAVPLLLHLFTRSRHRAVHWGAMMFLTGPGAGAQHTARLKQRFLLLLRMSAVGLLAAALARPVIAARYRAIPTAGLTTGGTAAVVIILDDGPSMGYTTNGKSRLDLARQVTLQLLSSLKRGDEASLLLAGLHEWQPTLPPSADLQSIASRVEDLEPDLGEPDFATDLSRAADLLDRTGPVDREIYLICDHQALGWRNITDAFLQRWRSHRANGPAPRVTVLPVGDDEADNVVVEAIDFLDRPVLRDVPNTLQVRIRNFGTEPAIDVPISVWTGNHTIRETTLSVPPHTTRTANIPFRFGDPGSRVVSAAVHTTGLTADDRLDVAVDVLDHLRVVLVDPDLPASPDPDFHPLSPLEAALDQAPSSNGLFRITTMTPEGLEAGALDTDVLILSDFSRLEPSQMKAIQHFVEGGGGLLMIPGSDSQPPQINSAFHGNGINLLPVNLRAESTRPTRIGSLEHRQIFRFASGKPDPFASTPITQYVTTAPNGTDAHILSRYTNGEPFLIEANIGRGRALLMTTGLTLPWNTLSDLPATAKLIQSMVRYLGAGAAVDRNLWLSQQLVATVDAPVEDHSAFVQSITAGTREPANITTAGDHTEIHYNKTSSPGVYRLRYRSAGKEQVLNYVVDAGHGSSDLTPLTNAQWRTLSKSIGFDRVDLSKITVADAIENQRGGREIWIDLLCGVLALMTVEMLLSRWWSS